MNPFLVDGCVAAGAVGLRGLLRRGLLLADLGHSVSEKNLVLNLSLLCTLQEKFKVQSLIKLT